jgi:hypothetical protein
MVQPTKPVRAKAHKKECRAILISFGLNAVNGRGPYPADNRLVSNVSLVWGTIKGKYKIIFTPLDNF